MSIKRFYMTVNHCLDILQDNSIDKNYKDEHRHLLSDLLDMKGYISVKILKIENISLYLQDIVYDKRTILDSMNMRLLKHYCKFILRDSSSGSVFGKFTEIMLEWFGRLFNVIDNDDNNLKGLISTYAECCLCIIDVYGTNFAETLFNYADIPLQIMTRLLMTHQLTRMEKLSILRFLLSYFQLSLSCHWSLLEPLAAPDPLIVYINEICISLLSDENMNSIMSTLYSSWSTRKSKDPQHILNAIDDAESRLNFEVVSRACYIHQLQVFYTKDRNVSNQRSNSSSLDQSSEPSNKRQKVHTSNCGASHIDTIIDKIKVSIINPKYKALVSSTNISAITSSPPSKYALEGYIFLVVMLCKLYPRGEFLRTSSSSDSIEDSDAAILRLYNFVVVLKCKLFETIEGSLDSNQQLLGCTLLALEGLALISSSVLSIEGYEIDNDSSTYSKLLRTEWNNILMHMLSDDRIRLVLVSVNKHSINERIIALTNIVLSRDLLDTVSTWSLQNLLWQLNINSDPRLVESSEYFSVLSTMLKFYQNESSQTFCQTYLRHAKDISSSSVAATAAITSPTKASDQHPLILSLHNMQIDGVLNVLVYMVSWLDIQLNVTSSKINIMNACSISKAFKEILFTILGSSTSSASNDNDYNMAIDAKVTEYLTLIMPTSGSYWNANRYNDYKHTSITNDTNNCPKPNIDTSDPITSPTIIFKCLEIFETLQDRLHDLYGMESRVDKRTEFSQWQLVCPILCSTYVSIAELLSSDKSSSGNSIDELMDVIMFSFYSLISESVGVLKTHFNTLSSRWNTMNEYVNYISILLKKMDATRNGFKITNRVNNMLEKLADSIIGLAQLMKDEIQSVTAREGSENGSNVVSSHRESVSNVTFDDDIDDAMDIDDHKSDTITRDLSRHSQGDKIVPRVFFTKDQLDCFCSVARCFLLTASDEERIAEVTDILGFNINDPKSHFGDTRCKYWVPLEVFFTLLEHVSQTGKCIATELLLHKFFDASVKNSSGSEEDISIKLFKFLGICYELTKNKKTFVNNQISAGIQRIIFFGVDDDEGINAEYGYMTKIMRIKCVYNLLKAPDLVIYLYYYYYHHHRRHHYHHYDHH